MHVAVWMLWSWVCVLQCGWFLGSVAKPRPSLAATPRWRLKPWHQIAQPAKQPAIYTCGSPADPRLSVSSTPTFCSLTQKHKNTKTQSNNQTIKQSRTLSDLAASRVTYIVLPKTSKTLVFSDSNIISLNSYIMT